MKKWENPQVRIDQFAANEYVAACSTTSDGGVTISCDYDGHYSNNPEHGRAHDNCKMEFTIPGSGWSLAKEASHKAKGVYWVDTNGNYIGKMSTGLPDPVSNAPYALGVSYYDTQKRYVYNIAKYNSSRNEYEYAEPSLIFDAFRNHYVFGTNNPNS